MNNFVVTVRECTRALAEERLRHATHGSQWLTRTLVNLEMARLELRMAALRTLIWLASVRQALGLGGAAPATA